VRKTEDGLPVQSFHSLLNNLGTLTRSTCRIGQKTGTPTVPLLTTPTPLQAKALELMRVYPVRQH
jgi:hypothetical protein